MRVFKKILALFALLLVVDSAIIVNQIIGVSNHNLVYSGSIPISTTGNLFFTYYGVDGPKQITTAINIFVKESVLEQSSKIIIGEESTFIRSLAGLDDISALKGSIHFSIWP
jgi:hypothetical protein